MVYRKMIRDENYFRKLEKSVKKYNMLAYKKLLFDYYPKIMDGEFLGEVINEDKDSKTYRLKLPSVDMFEKVHGELALVYSVYYNKNIVCLEYFEPIDILEEGHSVVLNTYKGVVISNKHSVKDKFKIDMLLMLR